MSLPDEPVPPPGIPDRETEPTEPVAASPPRTAAERAAALKRVEHEWSVESQQYLVQGRYGPQYVMPRVAVLLMGGILLTIVSGATLLTLPLARGLGGIAWLLPALGTAAIVGVLGLILARLQLAWRYERAHARYLERRAEAAGDDLGGEGSGTEAG